MSSASRNIAIIGNISRDSVWYGTMKRGAFFGGAGLNVACAVARYGLRPKLISVIGHQDAAWLHSLDHAIDTTDVQVVAGETCQFEIHYTEDGSFCRLSSRFGVAASFDAYLQNLPLVPGYYHVCCRHPLHPAPILADLARRNMPFSLDFIVSSATDQMAQCQAWIGEAFCVFVNLQELTLLKQIYPIEDIKKLVVTAGCDPIIVFQHGKEVARKNCPPSPAHEVTGAGDVVTGTFLALHLMRQEPLEGALEKAVDAAQISLSSLGTTHLIPRRKR